MKIMELQKIYKTQLHRPSPIQGTTIFSPMNKSLRFVIRLSTIPHLQQQITEYHRNESSCPSEQDDTHASKELYLASLS